MKKLSIYFTAGVPNQENTAEVAQIIQAAGANMMEIGIPYSDPVADGETIQEAHTTALRNGMKIKILFQQLEKIKKTVYIPKVLMSYFNPILQYGFEQFCEDCARVGVSGLIIPDLPPEEYERKYQKTVEQHGLNFTFLVTPETSEARIKYLDRLSSGFLYAVSNSSTTGNDTKPLDNEAYFKRLSQMELKNPIMIGFGIKNKKDFDQVTEHFSGGIIGSAFMKILLYERDWKTRARRFIEEIQG